MAYYSACMQYVKKVEDDNESWRLEQVRTVFIRGGTWNLWGHARWTRTCWINVITLQTSHFTAGTHIHKPVLQAKGSIINDN